MKYSLFIWLLIGVVSCAAEYVPSKEMLMHKNNMTTQDAIDVVQSNIWGGDADTKGVCGSRGFWYDSESNMMVNEDGINLLAHKRGKQLDKVSKGFDDVVVFEKQYYNYTFEFQVIRKINVYDDPLLLPVFPECNRKNSSSKYFVIDLNIDDLHNLKFIVYQVEFDRLMAALSILIPDRPVLLK